LTCDDGLAGAIVHRDHMAKLTHSAEIAYIYKVCAELHNAGLADWPGHGEATAIDYLLTCARGREIPVAGRGQTLPDRMP
jgi:hypothetical protein